MSEPLGPRPQPALDPAFAARPRDPRGEAMHAELRMIHDLLRQHLGVVQQLAAAVADGLDTITVQGQVAELSGPRGLRMLQVNCHAYCRFVHGHHGLEDAAMIPRVRAANPAIGPVADRLVADHVRVAVLLDAVERAADDLDGTDAARADVVTALDALRDHLLEHIAYEEAALEETMARMTGW